MASWAFLAPAHTSCAPVRSTGWSNRLERLAGQHSSDHAGSCVSSPDPGGAIAAGCGSVAAVNQLLSEQEVKRTGSRTKALTAWRVMQRGVRWNPVSNGTHIRWQGAGQECAGMPGPREGTRGGLPGPCQGTREQGVRCMQLLQLLALALAVDAPRVPRVSCPIEGVQRTIRGQGLGMVSSARPLSLAPLLCLLPPPCSARLPLCPASLFPQLLTQPSLAGRQAL